MRLLLVSLLCGAALAQCPSGYVQVSDTVYVPAAPAPGSSPPTFSGKVTISAPTIPTSTNSLTFGRDAQTITVTNGAFSACLAPNTAMNQQTTYYSVSFQDAQTHWTESWVVPASSVALKIPQIRGSIIASPNALVALAQLSTYGGTIGNCLTLTSGGPSWTSCGSSGTGKSWAAMTSVSWASITSTIWTGVTP